MKLDKRTEDILIDAATELKVELLREYIVRADDIDGIDKADQALAKMCVLIMACKSLTNAAEELNERLGVDVPTIEEKEKKGWN